MSNEYAPIPALESTSTDTRRITSLQRPDTTFATQDRDALLLLRNGRNRIEAGHRGDDVLRETKRTLQDVPGRRSKTRRSLDEALRQALAHNEFELFYQPRLDMGNLAVVGTELQVRWRRPGRNPVSPGILIGMAESDETIQALGLWVLHESCRQMSAWHRTGIDLGPMVIPLAPRQLLCIDLDEHIDHVLRTHDLTPDCLQLKIDEAALRTDRSLATSRIHALRRRGVAIALSRFHTYAGLSHLRRLPVDVLMIDRSWVRDIDTPDANQTIARHIVEFGEILHLAVVAEGIESTAQADMLQRLGCRLGQGFLYAPALPSKHIDSWISHNGSKGTRCHLLRPTMPAAELTPA